MTEMMSNARQVMGAPVAGSDVRAYVMTGGGLRLKNLRPSIRSRRVQMIFPLTGTERRGLVSLEAKKRKVHAQPHLPPTQLACLCANVRQIKFDRHLSLRSA